MIRLLEFIKIKWIALTLFILVAITFLSLWPLKNLSSVPGTDKIHHLIAYASLMLPTALRKPNSWILIGLCFIAYSGVIELFQPYVNRYGEWSDMFVNTAGVVCGLIIAEIINILEQKISNKLK